MENYEEGVPVVPEFDWHSSRTPDTKCRVSIAKRSMVLRVYIEPTVNGVSKPGFTFRPEELPHIIEALQKARALLDG